MIKTINIRNFYKGGQTKPETESVENTRICNPALYQTYWVPQKLPQVYTVIAYICIGKVA